MFVILAYDVNQSRNRKVHKLCRQYLYAAEESVFEGIITDYKLSELKQKIKEIIVPDEDTCIIYEINNTRYCRKECLGRQQLQNETIVLD